MDFTALSFALSLSTADPAMPDEGTGYNKEYEIGLQIRHDAGPFLELGVEQGESTIVGQSMSTFQAATAGIGYRYNFNQRFSLEASAGVWVPFSDSQRPVVIEEMVLNVLGRNHSGPWLADEPYPLTPVPEEIRGWYLYESCEGQIARGQDPDYSYCFGQGYDTEWSPYVKVDFGFQATKNIRLSTFYRHLTPETNIGLWRDGTFATGEEFQNTTGRGWWRDISDTSFSEVGIKISWEF